MNIYAQFLLVTKPEADLPLSTVIDGHPVHQSCRASVLHLTQFSPSASVVWMKFQVSAERRKQSLRSRALRARFSTCSVETLTMPLGAAMRLLQSGLVYDRATYNHLASCYAACGRPSAKLQAAHGTTPASARLWPSSPLQGLAHPAQ